MVEKRVAERREFREAVQYQVVESFRLDREGARSESRRQAAQRRGCIGVDLSEAGLRLYADDFVPLNKEMLVSFHLQNRDFVELTGKVVWVQKIPHGEYFHIGLKFEDSDLQVQSKGALQRFLHSPAVM